MRKRITVARIGAIAAVLLCVASCYTSPELSRAEADPVLSWPGDPGTTVAISWFSRVAGPAVEFQEPDGTTRTVAGERDGPISTVIVEGLNPDTEYAYCVAGSSEWHSFRTIPAHIDRIEFAVLGDLQPFNEETERTTRMVMNRVAGLDPAFVVQIGDLAEVGIRPRSVRLALSIFSDVAADRPAIVAAGNHDYYYGMPSARYFKNVFPAANPTGSSGRRDTWYSVSVGPMHFAVLDTEANGSSFDTQLEWLESDLASVTENGAEWVFIVMHRPMLVSATGGVNEKWAQAIFPLIARYDVDAVFWGHDHLLEHYEYAYGENGLVFDQEHIPASEPTHYFTVPSAGARVDCLYPGFFTHNPMTETWRFVSLDTGQIQELVFDQRPWNPEIVRREMPGIRYQDPERYPKAASYYYWPFDSAEDEAAGRYSSDLSIRYTDNAEFFGYTYGETSIGYLWVELEGDRCVITAHYVDGSSGEHGPVISTPGGLPLMWELP
jgi:hypothetical protein